MITRYHAKYYATMLSQHTSNGDIDCLSQSLLSSTVDINPHQIDAALFAFRSPLSKGIVLADEVGLGKTIEAGLVLCQYWSTGKSNKHIYYSIFSFNFLLHYLVLKCDFHLYLHFNNKVIYFTSNIFSFLIKNF